MPFYLYIIVVKMVTPWQNNRSFEETNWYMLKNEILCDVTFLAGSSRREIKAHKFLLASRCPVFYTMFCNSSDELSDTVKIADVEFDILKEILRLVLHKCHGHLSYCVIHILRQSTYIFRFLVVC